MTVTNADRCIANTLVYEGGFTADWHDPGNWTGGKVGAGELKGTNFGIAANTYPDLDIRDLSRTEAIAIYRRDFWPKVAGNAMPMGVDQLAYDGAVNSGPSRGLRWVAQACGIPDERRASVIAAAACAAADKTVLIKRASANRMAFLRGLGTFARYGGGWTRRVAAMEALGVKMALQAAGKPINDKLKAEQTSATKDSRKAATTSAATAGADAAAHQTIDAGALDWIQTAALWLGLAALLGVAIYFAWRAFEHRQRANAYADVMAGKTGG